MKSRVVRAAIAALFLSGSSFGVGITFSVKFSATLKSGEFAQVETDRTGIFDMPLAKGSGRSDDLERDL